MGNLHCRYVSRSSKRVRLSISIIDANYVSCNERHTTANTIYISLINYFNVSHEFHLVFMFISLYIRIHGLFGVRIYT